MTLRARSCRLVRQEADLGESVGADQGADADGPSRIENLSWFEGRKESVDVLWRRHIDPLKRMGQDEAVHADHDRRAQGFGDPEGLDVQIGCLLVIGRKELDPPRVSQRHRVGMVVPDVDGCADGPVADRHHDGQPEPRGVVDDLCHEEEALAGGGGVGTGAGGAGSDGDAQGRELRFDVHEGAAGELAPANHLPERLHDVGLWRDRVGADHLGPAARHGLRHRT